MVGDPGQGSKNWGAKLGAPPGDHCARDRVHLPVLTLPPMLLGQGPTFPFLQTKTPRSENE